MPDFPTIIPTAERVAADARKFASYITSVLPPPPPAPLPQNPLPDAAPPFLPPVDAAPAAPAMPEGFSPSPSGIPAPPPSPDDTTGGFQPPPPPPDAGGFLPPGPNTYSDPIGESPEQQAQRFADYAGPVLNGFTRLQTPGAQGAPPTEPEAPPAPEIAQPSPQDQADQFADYVNQTAPGALPQPNAFNRLQVPGQLEAPPVPDPTSGPFAPEPDVRAATAIEQQIGRVGGDVQRMGDLSAQQIKGPLPPEQQQQLGDLSSNYGLALTPEPLANAGAKAASSLGAQAIAKTNKMYDEAAGGARTPIGQRLGALGTTLTQAVTDAGVDLTNLEQVAADARGRSLNADEMASLQSRLNPFYTARTQVDEGIRPAINGLSDQDYADVRNVLTWRGNVDVAAAKGNPNRTFSGDLTAAESQAALNTLGQQRNPATMAGIDRRVQQVVDFNKAELERDVAAGLVSRETADRWLQEYPNYTPVMISDYLKEQGRAIGAGKSLNVGGTGYKSLSTEGTARGRVDPIAASVDAAYQGEALRRQNIAWRALHDMIQSTPEFQDLFQVQKGGYTGATKYENSVSGFIDGERYTITTPFPDIAKAIRQEAGGVSIPGWNTAMALYKELITGRNPTFLVGNAAIDAPLAVLTTAMREGGAQHILPIVVDLFKGYADAFKGVLSGQYLGTATNQYLKGGGGMGFYGSSATSGANEVARLRRQTVLHVASPGDAARLVKDLVTLEWVKGLGERVELGPRAMAYNRARKRGLPPEQAVLQGRTVTVDFQQGGTVAKLVNSFVPFLNPAIQGVATTGRVIRENPKGALLTLGPALAGPALAAEAWNRADPERSRAYDDVPDYVKDRGIVIMLPGAPPLDEKGEPHPQFVAINLRQLAPLAAATRAVYDRVVGIDDHRTAASLLGGAVQQISPVQDVSGLLPPFATTAAELAANRDLYRRSDIATTRNDERASALSQAVAGPLGVRPSQAEFALRQTTGGVGEMAAGGSDLLAGRTKQSGTPQDVPVAGGFARRLVRGDTGQELQTARSERLQPEVQRALADAGMTPDVSIAPNVVRKTKLTQAQQLTYQRELNARINELLGPTVRDPGFRDLPMEVKKKLVSRMTDAAHRMAGAAALGSR